MYGSELKTYSIGIAAENKPLDTRQLNITPIEALPALDGEITFSPQELLVSGTDSFGNRYEVRTTLDNTVTAEWLPMGSNRLTPPDIRRGEFVEVLRLGDSDRFFWRPMGLRDDLRRLETVIYAFNANPNETEGNGIDIQNCYFLEISTHRKLVTFGTSKANGEPFQYTFQINTDEGLVTLTDDIGNYIELDSGERSLRIENADRSFVHVDKRRIRAQTPDEAWVEIDGRDIHLENSAGAFVDLREGQIRADAGELLELKVGDSVFTLTPSGTTLRTPRFDGEQS